MNLTTIGPALITGVVGVVGVAGSVWSARLNTRSVDKRDQIAVKRRVYSESYSTFTRLHQQLWRFANTSKSGWSDQERNDAIARLYESKDSLIQTISELALILTSNQVEISAGDAYNAFVDTLEAYAGGETAAPSLDYLTELQHSFLNAMRDDIGN